MIELNGVEPESADGVEVNSRSQIYVSRRDDVDLKPGDEVLVLVKHKAEQKREDYGVPLRLTDNSEPGENDVVVQYGERVFVAQKLPEFI
jgi:hypothetical protein